MAKKKLPEDEGKMTIYDYEQKYVRRQNVRGAKLFLRIIIAAVAILIFACLLSVTLKFFDIHLYAGIAAAVASLLLYIFLFIVPVVKLVRTSYFVTNVNAFTAREAQKHNKKVRREISEKIIDLTASVEGVGWYDSRTVGELAIAVQTDDEQGIKKSLTALYTGSVKRSARELIFRSSLRSGMYSAISQANTVDALLVAFINIQLVKDIVFLYGFRPSDARLARIFATVLQNSLVAYGVSSLRIGKGVARTMGDAVKGIPLLGGAISAIVDSSVQGLTNGVLTTVIGYQTISYLNKEYRLQDILDGVEIDATQTEIEESCEELEKELRGKKPKAQAV